MEETQNPYEPTEQRKVEERYSIWTRPLTFGSCLFWLFMIPFLIVSALVVLLFFTCAGVVWWHDFNSQ